MPLSATKSNKPRQVWVVDDSLLEANEAKRALDANFEVTVFTDGSTMLERLADVLPDAVVLDWVMPGLSGVEVCRFLRTNKPTVELPVLMLTSHQGTQEVVEGLAAGANDYVTKPYAPEELLARVAALVRSKVLRERMDKAEAALADVLEHHPDPLITLNRDATIAFINADAVQMLGGDADALRGKPLAKVLPALRLPDPLYYHPVLLPDLKVGNSLYEPAVRAFPGGNPSWISISFRDVTSKRQVDARRLDFYSMAAHDLRSPMQAILLRLGRLNRKFAPALPPEARSDLTLVDSRVRELSSMLDDFLDLARMEGVGLRVEREQVDLLEAVRTTAEMLQPLVDAGQLTLSVEGEPGSARVSADARRIRQALSNLLSNAIKFTPPGGKVTVRVVREGERVRASITDTGRGISAEALPHVFERYVSAVDRSRATVGTGLGLMIVQEVVEAHGGKVGVASELNQGATFWFELPAV